MHVNKNGEGAIQGHDNNEKRTIHVHCNNKVKGISRNITLPRLKTIQGHCNNGKRTIPGHGNRVG